MLLRFLFRLPARRVDGGVVEVKHFLLRSSRTSTYRAVSASKFMDRPSDAPIPASVCPNTSPVV
ncbi:MAG: hypothetical protein LBK41_02355 [Clostridiales bacterium]|nr:hypothetical protein [Clostridiales bacterium]